MTAPVGAASAMAMRDVARALREIRAAQPGYEAAREYDEINIYDDLLETRLGRTLRQASIEFDPNFCGVVIDSRTDRMSISSITGTSDAETADANAVWEANELDLYWPSWMRNAIRDGDGYLVAWPRLPEPEVAADDDFDGGVPDEDYEPPASIWAGVTLTPEMINVTYVDPTRGRMFYDEENPRERLYFAQLWCDDVPGSDEIVWRMNLLYPNRIEKYGTPPTSRKIEPSAAQFQPWSYGELVDELDPEPNPFGQIPAFHLRTDLQYGKPEHRNAFALQDAVSKLIEMQMVTVEFQGFPQQWALQEANSLGTQTLREDPTADDYVGNVFGDQFDDMAPSLNSIPNGQIGTETGAEMESGPGNMQMFKNVKEVGQFTSADPAAFLEPWREYTKAISTTTSTPGWQFKGLGMTVPSGIALKVDERPLNRRCIRLSKLFSATLRQMYGCIFDMLGQPNVIITFTWDPFETIDETERWTLVKLRVDAGVPLKEALMMAGITENQAGQWAAEEEARKAAQLELERLKITSAPVPGVPPEPA